MGTIISPQVSNVVPRKIRILSGELNHFLHTNFQGFFLFAAIVVQHRFIKGATLTIFSMFVLQYNRVFFRFFENSTTPNFDKSFQKQEADVRLQSLDYIVLNA